MQINKIHGLYFGMPKISNQIKKMLPKNLSPKDIELIKQVETIYPNAKMEIESNYGDSLSTKYTAIDEMLSRIGIYYPIYRIVISGKTGNENLPLDGTFSNNGTIFPSSKSDSLKFKKGHASKVTTTGFVKHRQIKPSDLKKIVKLYDEDIKDIEALRKQLELD